MEKARCMVGLTGVVVGGLISTGWKWLAAIRQELADGVVGARLVDHDLTCLEISQQAFRMHRCGRKIESRWRKSLVFSNGALSPRSIVTAPRQRLMRGVSETRRFAPPAGWCAGAGFSSVNAGAGHGGVRGCRLNPLDPAHRPDTSHRKAPVSQPARQDHPRSWLTMHSPRTGRPTAGDTRTPTPTEAEKDPCSRK